MKKNCIIQLFINNRLLDVLAKRKDPKGLKKGSVLVDDQLMKDDFRLMSGYVVQVIISFMSKNMVFFVNQC